LLQSFPDIGPVEPKLLTKNLRLATVTALPVQGYRRTLCSMDPVRGALLLPRLGHPPRHQLPRPCPGVRRLSYAPVGICATAAVWDGSLLPLPNTEARGTELACRRRATVLGTLPMLMPDIGGLSYATVSNSNCTSVSSVAEHGLDMLFKGTFNRRSVQCAVFG